MSNDDAQSNRIDFLARLIPIQWFIAASLAAPRRSHNDLFLQRHWRRKTQRSVADDLRFDAVVQLHYDEQVTAPQQLLSSVGIPVAHPCANMPEFRSREPLYNAAENSSLHTASDPYLRPAFSLGNRLRRWTWNVVWLLLYRASPRPFHAWRSLLLRLYGATMGPNCHFYPASKVWAPWNLVCAEQVTAADGAEIYNPAAITFGGHAILSQDAYICGATHDYDDPAFPLIAFAMSIGSYAWVCARASVAPGVNVGDGAVLGLGSVATRDLKPWTVYAGVPAVEVKARRPHTL